MKKLLLGTLVLLAFNAAVIITQMSCNKDAKADTPAPGTTALKQLDLVLFLNYGKGANNEITSEVWTCKLDGTGKTKVNITLPAKIKVGEEASLTPDGKTIVFGAYEIVSTTPNYKEKDAGIYTCPIEGGIAKKIVDGNPLDNYYNTLQGAY
ncbi:MAG: hypothetical protein J7623_24420 [Chitinophaga sp.]|uniref:hypothetical protein n=1 Tax=Chitinophaga sp. TaxID=1869181 RepID=UPI001B06A74A|nr:hypothetical protein [Chitinophaga sp.]MBO9731809.1 hypothetical protein [Chitinophaga sp.]